MASIALAFVSRSDNGGAITELAQWAVETVFAEPDRHRNIVVREGFRAVVEKGRLMGLVSEEDAKNARPTLRTITEPLPLDEDVLQKGGREIYPIVHDLAWYVIERAYSKFMDYESVDSADGRSVIDYEDPREGFLANHLTSIPQGTLNSSLWAKAAAIAYMKSLGFNRDQGNGYTEATHGSKSKHFTLEEKYTWLAVHYLQGYLADHLPLKDSEEPVSHYSQVTDIPNPAEFLPAYEVDLQIFEDKWLIPETLAPELTSKENVDEQIEAVVTSEPSFDFEKWIQFDADELFETGGGTKWLLLHGHTSVHDSQQFIRSRMIISSALIDKGQAKTFVDLLKNEPDHYFFVQHLDRMYGSADTDTYSNPSDIVWMDWIGERDWREDYSRNAGEEKWMIYTTTSVTRNTVDGEEEVLIPSKTVRQLLQISKMQEPFFMTGTGKVKGYMHLQEGSNYDRQQLLLAPIEELRSQLNARNLDIVWFVDVYISKNPLNQAIKSELHPMKTRKYFVYQEGGAFIQEKIWDARFSNRRDGDKDQ